MGLVKVWNDNELDFVGKYKDQEIKIPAKSYIEMEYDEAHSFKSSPHPMQFDGMGQQLRSSYKMIRVEGARPEDNTVMAFRCHMDGSLHPSAEALNSYVQAKGYANTTQDAGLPHQSAVKGELRGPGRANKL